MLTSDAGVRLLVGCAGLMGAAGVGLAAIAAHAAQGSSLASAAYILLFHAAAVLAGASLIGRSGLASLPLKLALLGWVIGSALFASDITLRTFEGFPLFPMAAPTGGSTLILAWLALAAAALLGKRST